MWEYTCKTAEGLELDKKLMAGETKLILTKAKVGAGKVNPAQLVSQTDVTKPAAYEPELRSQYRLDATAVEVPVTVNNATVETGFALWQVGIFARDPDKGEILYFLVQNEKAREIPSQDVQPGFILETEFVLGVGNASQVNVTINPAETSTQERSSPGEELDQALNNKVDKVPGKDLSSNDLTNELKRKYDAANDHMFDKENPHNVTKAQVGLRNVDNTADTAKPISTAQQAALDKKADLDSHGKVSTSQLPSYVDDVLEYEGVKNFPDPGETGKIYTDILTNLTYRWSGSVYSKLDPSLALGETSTTAYRGDRGKYAYGHSQSAHARLDATKTEKSNINGNIKINDAEVQVYDDTHQIGKRSTEGSFLTIKSPIMKPVITNLQIEGKSRQVQTTGKNLCPSTGKNGTLHGIAFQRNNDGTITFSGTNTYSDDVWFNVEEIHLPAGTYTVSGITGGSASTYYIRIGTGRDNTWFAEVYNGQRTFTFLESTLLSVTLSFKPGITFDNTMAYIQIERDAMATAYEPYTENKPSPNPDYPQEIKSVVNPTITACGKNLLNLNVGTYSSANCVTYTFENEEIVLTNTTTPSDSWRCLIWRLKEAFVAGRTINLSYKTTASKSSLIPTVAILFYKNGVQVKKIFSHGTVPDFDVARMQFIMHTEVAYPGDGTIGDTVSFYDIQIEDKGVATTYEPYADNTATLDGITLRSLPDGTADRLEKRDGVWGVERYAKEIVFNGSEAWGIGHVLAGVTYKRYRIEDNSLKYYGNNEVLNARCTYFYAATRSNAFSGSGLNSFTVDATSDISFYVNYSTLEEWKAYLSQQHAHGSPVTVHCALATPIWEPLPDALQTELNKLECSIGTTHIFTDSSLNPYMVAEYNQAVPVEYGGTGVTTVEAAREVLGINKIISDINSILAEAPLYQRTRRETK